MEIMYSSSVKNTLFASAAITFLVASTLLSAEPVPATEDCEGLFSSYAVKEAIKKARDSGYITSAHRCLIRETHEIKDIGQLLEEIPENTVLLIRQLITEPQSLESLPPIAPELYAFKKMDSQVTQFQETAERVLKAFSFTSTVLEPSHPPTTSVVLMDSSEPISSGKISLQVIPRSTTPICVPSKSRVRLKAGTVMLGINDYLSPESSTIPVCEMQSPGQIGYMFEVGDNDEFQNIGNILISGFSFFPKIDNNPNPVDSIWRVRCYEGKLQFARNYFQLDTRASVYFQCLQPQPEKSDGITFSFRENTIVGMGSTTSEEGLLVDLRNLNNTGKVLDEADVSGNLFTGNIKSAVEARFNKKALAVISNNHFYMTSPINDLELYGPGSYVSQQERPEFVIQGNVFASSQNCFKVFGGMTIDSRENLFNCSSLFAKNDREEFYWSGYSQPDITLRYPSNENLWLHSGHCPIASDNFITGRMELMTKTDSACSYP